METFLKDIRYGYRTLLKNPGFTAVAVLSLALGIGANTAIFSFIDTVLLRPLPVHEPERLAALGESRGRGIYGGTPEGSMELFGWQQFRNFRLHNQVFEDVTAINSLLTRVYFTSSGDNTSGAPEGAQASLVSGNFFQVLGVRPAAGRFFDAKTDAAFGGSPLIVLNHAFWTARFGRNENIIGQTMRIGDRSFSIIGVAPENFFGTRLGDSPDFWIPLSMLGQMPGSSSRLLAEPLLQFACLMGRLKPGVTLAQAQANVNVIYQQMLPGQLPGSASAEEREMIRHAHVVVKSGARGFTNFSANYELPLRVLMIVVAMVLVIACANVANLLLALGAKRQKEFALRVAIGANRRRVIRQVLTESLMMAGCGGLLGILIASWGGKLLVHMISTGPRTLPVDFSIDSRVLAFTVMISIATGVLFGLVPALRASRTDVNSSLKESKASLSSAKMLFGRLLVAGQVALSLGLLVTAGLLLHSFRNLISVSTGFDRQNVLLFKLDTESSGYQSDARLVSLYQRIEEKIAHLPGVGAEGVSLFAFNEGRRTDSFEAPGVNLPAAQRFSNINYVSPGYFSVLHIPILLGRPIGPADTLAGEQAAVISESLAKKIFGNVPNALGRQLLFDEENKPIKIVGIAGDAKVDGVRDKNLIMTYRSACQVPAYLHNLAVRVSGDPASVASRVREAIRSTEKNLPIRWTTTLADAVSDSLVRERAIAQLSTFFAGLALFLSAIGLYGTISFAVARRTSEIGIRMALGAERTGVLGMILRDAMLLAGIGMAIGLPLALIITRQMESMLYGLGKVDPWSVIGSVLALAIVAAISGYLPARRAASVDPMVALRYE